MLNFHSHYVTNNRSLYYVKLTEVRLQYAICGMLAMYDTVVSGIEAKKIDRFKKRYRCFFALIPYQSSSIKKPNRCPLCPV